MKTWGKYIGLVVILAVLLLVGIGYQSDKSPEELRQKYGQAPSDFIQVDGMKVHYRREGKRLGNEVPLVLMHGTGASLHTWDGWVNQLASDFEIIRLDLPAYGLTGPEPRHDYSMEAYVEFLGHFLDKVGVSECYLAGNSLGGAVAWEFALKHPQRVKKMILVDAAGYPLVSKSVPIAFRMARNPIAKHLIKYVTPRIVAESSVKNVYFDDTKVTASLVERYWLLTLREGNREAFVKRLNAPTTQRRTWKDIHQLSMPVMIQWGRHDELIPLAIAERFHNDLPNDTLIVYQNAGHVPMEEIPVPTAKDAREFLRKKN